MQPEIIKEKISPKKLREHLDVFPDMVKIVVDIEQEIMAIGSGLHADAEQILLEQGSKQDNLWEANIYPDRDRSNMIEYVSMINIRPRLGQREMEITDKDLKKKIKKVIEKLIK